MQNRITLAMAAFLLAAGTVAISTTAYAEEKKSSLNTADEKFVKQTGEAGMAEVKIATLGSQKAERADVKECAAMLIKDHTKVNEELAELAKSKGVQLSAVIAPSAAETFKELEKESGAGFDKAFLAHMEKSHKTSVSAFEDAEKDAKDGALKEWVSKTLPTLKQHLQMVKDLRAK